MLQLIFTDTTLVVTRSREKRKIVLILDEAVDIFIRGRANEVHTLPYKNDVVSNFGSLVKVRIFL